MKNHPEFEFQWIESPPALDEIDFSNKSVRDHRQRKLVRLFGVHELAEYKRYRDVAQLVIVILEPDWPQTAPWLRSVRRHPGPALTVDLPRTHQPGQLDVTAELIAACQAMSELESDGSGQGSTS